MRWQSLASLLAALGLFYAAGVVGEYTRDAKSERTEDDVVYLPTSEALRLMAVGYDDLVADVLWLRTVTYYGEWRHGSHGIDFFRELAHRVVDLDPHFTDAYRFGALVLADDLDSFDEGIALLEKGMAEMPDEWWLPFEAGFLNYTVRFDDQEAARWFTIAAHKPNAPDIAKRFAAFVTSRAGDLNVSLELWRFVAETTRNSETRKKALEYVEELQAAIDGTGPVPDWVTRKRVVNGRVEDGDV